MSEKDKDEKPKKGRGGPRANSGRPLGSKNKISLATSQTVVEMLYNRTGRVYEDILIEDFLQARATNPGLTHRYHVLLSNKLMPDLQALEVTDAQDQIELRRQAFIDALTAMTNREKL